MVPGLGGSALHNSVQVTAKADCTYGELITRFEKLGVFVGCGGIWFQDGPFGSLGQGRGHLGSGSICHSQERGLELQRGSMSMIATVT